MNSKVGAIQIGLIIAMLSGCSASALKSEQEHVPSIDKDAVGLVLSGGAAKGAYEVGVWKAMKEAGIAENVVAISGTSVGALNAALFATEPDLRKIESVWLNDLRGLLKPNETWVTNVKEKIRYGMSVSDAVLGDPKRRFGTGRSIQGAVDPCALSNIIVMCLPRVWAKSSPAVFSTSCRIDKDGWPCAKSYWLNNESQERRVSLLRASSAIPYFFSSVNVDGEEHVDGYLKMNTPIKPLVQQFPDVKTIYAVYLDVEEDIRKSGDETKYYSGKRIVEIFPSKDLNGWWGHRIIDFSEKNSKKLMKLGYEDAKKILAERHLIESQP